MHVHTAVDLDDLAGDEARVWSAEESDHRGDLIGAAEASERSAAQESLFLVPEPVKPNETVVAGI